MKIPFFIKNPEYLPNICCFDNTEILIESCKKIIEYNDIQVRILYNNLIITIWGENLSINIYEKNAVSVSGIISSIEFEKANEL